MSKPIRPAAELRQYLRENGWNLSAAFLLTYWLQGTVFGTSGNALFEEGGAEIILGAAENAGALFFVLLFLTYCRRLKWALVPLTLLLCILEPFAGMTGNALLTPANIETVLGSDIHEAIAVLRTASPLDFVLPGFWTVVIEWMIAAKVKPFPPAETRTKFIWSISALCALPLVFITAPVGSMAFSVSEAGKTASWHALPESEQESAAGTAPEISTRVLVIGEALRADALQLYGNPFETSPFLSSVPVKMIRTAVSPSMETMTAVPLMLTLSGNQNGTLRPQLENNAVALAGEAGWKTYWISAQGKHRSDDLPVARIAGHADEAVWIDRHDDTKLPKVFEEILNRQDSERNSRKRFFVIHAYGSHEDVCDRTEDMGRPFAAGKEKYLDCYLASALKADRIIERLVRALEKRRTETGEGWSLVFTSDHASAIERRPGGALVHRRDVTNAHMYIVPFVQMGSDIREAVGFDTVRAMNRFAEWFPNWMGFGTNLTDPEFDIFTAPDDDPVIVRPDGQTVPFRDLKKGQSFTEILGIEKDAKEGGRHGH